MQKVSIILALVAGWANVRLSAAEAKTNIPPVQNRLIQEGALGRENVTDEQRAKLKEANDKFRVEQNGLYEKLRTARRELEQSAQADVTDEKTIRAKASAIGQIEGDLAMLRARHYKELRTILPREQAARQSGVGGTNQQPAKAIDVRRESTKTNVARPLPSQVPAR